MLPPQQSSGSATTVTVTALLAAELAPAPSTATTTPSAGPDDPDEQLRCARDARQVALHLAERGVAVAAVARASAELTGLPAEAARVGGRLRAFAADVTAPVEVENAFAAVDADLGPVTLAVACAGTGGPLGPLHLADPEAWWRAVEVDLRGSMLTARSALGRMVGSGGGRFVMVYGNLGDRLGGYVSAFAAAKAGVARLTEVLAGEVADSGVGVFGIHPGFVRTPLTERLAWGAEGRAWLPRFGVGVEDRWGDGRPAADLVEAIALGRADVLSGRVLHVGDNLAELAAESVGADEAPRPNP